MLVNEVINAKDLPVMEFDGIIVGGGGAGMRASLQLAESGLNTAVISKVFPTRSHTVSAQGGITCAIQSDDPDDDWRWHMFDTVKGSDYIGDQEAIEYMCSEGPKAVFELEHMGLPFSRTEEGRIYQRPFGGQSKDYGKGGQATRTCAAADRTGHSLLHTLFQANLKAGTNFLNEWFAVDLVLNADKAVVGVIAFKIETGEIYYIKSKATVLATGGAGRIYSSTTNALINSGDGIGMALRAGMPVQDIEMWQFHPTGIHGAGTLVTEGCRGEGGYLLNKDGERFMERYAPNAKDLASRDVVSRAMTIEINEGRGIGPKKDHINLHLHHIDPETLHKRLPGISETAKIFCGVDVTKEPIPVLPTVHYNMGGIPTNFHGEVLSPTDDDQHKVVPGLMAIGEAACVSVHGANRLGTNSLLDIVVFGRAAAMRANDTLKKGQKHSSLDKDISDQIISRLDKARFSKGDASVGEVRSAMQNAMQKHAAVFRSNESLQEGVIKIDKISKDMKNVGIKDKSLIFNTDLIESLELDNLMQQAMVTMRSADQRKESRGAHAHENFPNRDDKDWMKHTVMWLDKDKKSKLSYRDVTLNTLSNEVSTIPPVARVY